MKHFLNPYTEIEELGGGYVHQTFYIKPVAYYDGGVLRRINPNWGDSGISARPHMVSASQAQAFLPLLAHQRVYHRARALALQFLRRHLLARVRQFHRRTLQASPQVQVLLRKGLLI